MIVGILAGVTALALRPSSDHHAPSPCGPVDQTPRAIGTPAAGAATICLLNQERTSRGVPPLAQAGVLNQAAQEHSDDMVQRLDKTLSVVQGFVTGPMREGAAWFSGFRTILSLIRAVRGGISACRTTP